MTLAERLRTTLDARPAGQPIVEPYLTHEHYAPAAVLVAVTDRAEPGVLLTVRHPGLRRHAGQIAFPGGRTDPEDRDPIETALREAEEEIGLPRARVEIVGVADRYRSGSGYDITPVIGVIPPDLPLVPHEAEVSDIFEVPLTFLLATANHIERAAEFRGVMRNYHEIIWNDRRIWGVTAGVIVALSARLGAFA